MMRWQVEDATELKRLGHETEQHRPSIPMRVGRFLMTTVTVSWMWSSGCVAPRAQHGHHVHGDAQTQVVPVSYEPDEPATLPVEKELEGTNSIDRYVELALARNQEILAAQRAVQATAETIPQAEALDDPMLIDTFQPIDDNSVQTAAGRGANVLTLSQKFPWFGKLRLRGAIAEQSAQIALTRLTQAQLKVTEQVRLACYECYFNQRAIQITEEDKSLLGDLLMFAEARYRTGQTSQQDVLRAQVELDRIEDRLILLRRQLRQSQADLAGLLHTSPESELRVDTEAPVPDVPDAIERLYEAAIECRPELQERLHAIVQSQQAIELAELQYSPDVTVGVGWQAIATDGALSGIANGNDNVSFLVGVNLPIWADKLDASVREAEHRTMENARRYDAVKDDTFRTIKRLVVQVRALDEQTHLFRDSIIPKAEQTLRVSTADYRVAKVDFQQIIDNWSDLLAFHINLVRLESNLGQTLASLERVVGCKLADVGEDGGASKPAAASQKGVQVPSPLPSP